LNRITRKREENDQIGANGITEEVEEEKEKRDE
jgi:hypothetical protein